MSSEHLTPEYYHRLIRSTERLIVDLKRRVRHGLADENERKRLAILMQNAKTYRDRLEAITA